MMSPVTLAVLLKTFVSVPSPIQTMLRVGVFFLLSCASVVKRDFWVLTAVFGP